MNDRADRPGTPAVFHERRTYKLRRLMEAARLAPVLGVFLFLVPLLWPNAGDGRISSSAALIYIFVAWVAMIVLTWALSTALGGGVEQGADTDGDA